MLGNQEEPRKDDARSINTFAQVYCICAVSRKLRINNLYFRNSVLAPQMMKMRAHRLRWFRHVMRRGDEALISFITKGLPSVW